MQFRAQLWRYPGPGGWIFVTLPADAGLPVTGAFGRTPVRATVDGKTWATSVWRTASGDVLLAVPKKVRAGKEPPAEVEVRVVFDVTR